MKLKTVCKIYLGQLKKKVWIFRADQNHHHKKVFQATNMSTQHNELIDHSKNLDKTQLTRTSMKYKKLPEFTKTDPFLFSEIFGSNLGYGGT